MASRELWRNTRTSPSSSSAAHPQIFIGPPEKHDVTVTYTSTRGQKNNNILLLRVIECSYVWDAMPDLSGCLLLAALLIFCEDGYVRRAEGGVLSRGLASLSEEDNASDTHTSPLEGQGNATVPPSGNGQGISCFIFSIIYIHSIICAISSACGVRANNRDVFMVGYITTKDMGALLTDVLGAHNIGLTCIVFVNLFYRATRSKTTYFKLFI